MRGAALAVPLTTMNHQQIADQVLPAARAAVWKITKSTDIQEEAVAHTLRTIIDKFDRWDGRPLGGWATTIARNKAIDLKKLVRNQVSYDALESVDLPTYQPEDPETYDALYRAINQLSPKKRELMVLHYLEGMEMQTVAERVGTSLSNVKVTCMRARQDLKKLLSQ